ncbi:Alpha-soluble NSF attachment protein [Diplonema papillatum]|nr:Alpha-soluble NSF attachment protein [Diplonema papillatum]
MAEKARELVEKGDKKTKKFFGGAQKYEEARDCYQQAANQYKKVQDWEGAAAAFMKCYDMSAKVKSETDMIQDLTDAGNAYRKFSPDKATGTFSQVLELLDKNGRYDRAAKLCVETAKVCEAELLAGTDSKEQREELQDSIVKWYNKARDYYKLMRNSVTHANDCLAKVADIACLQFKFEEAIEMYEELGKHCVDDNLLRFNAKAHFFTALLCQLPLIAPGAGPEGIERFRAKFEEYCDLDMQFCENTHEYDFCKGVIQAFEDEDPQAYKDAYRRYDRIIPLEKHKEIMVLKGQEILKHEDYT